MLSRPKPNRNPLCGQWQGHCWSSNGAARITHRACATGTLVGPHAPATGGVLEAPRSAAALEDREFTEAAVQFNNRWLEFLTREISALGLKVWPSIANFVLVSFPKGEPQAESANAFLMERGLIVRAVKAYGLPDSLRISIGLEDDNRAVVKALADFLKG